jgi:transcriptional regulator with XRE-family HTH domain
VDFAAAIREARTSKGIAQRALAEKAGIRRNTLQRLETDGAGNLDSLNKIAAGLEMRFVGLPRGKSFGQAVQHLRERRGWSLSRLADRTGVSIPTLRRLEDGGNVQVPVLACVLAILAPRMALQRVKLSPWVYQSRDDRFTPTPFLERLRRALGRRIDLDPCGHPAAFVKAKTIWTAEDDGLSRPWRGIVYVNPPWSEMARWLRKTRAEWDAGHCDVIAMLLPYRLYQQTWRDTLLGVTDCFLLIGRVEYLDPEGRETMPHGNALVIFGADRAMIDRVLTNYDCVHLSRRARIGMAA